MTKITACEIFDHMENKYYTLYVEWFNSYFKVILLESTMLPLSGEMNIDNVNHFSAELSKSPDEYLKITEKILCGEDTEIQFFIKNKILEWKKKVWIYGRIELHSISDIQVVCESFQQLVKFYNGVQNKISILKEENKNLIYINEQLSLKIQNMIELKTTMEEDLYTKFIVILNSKKKKIRELEEAIKGKKDAKESIFDACTDESGESENEDKIIKNVPTVSIKIGKRKSLKNDNSKHMQKITKTNDIVDDKIIHKASTSKDCVNSKVVTLAKVYKKRNKYEEGSCSFKKKSRSSLNFSEEESEEELFSQ
ncbi:hypothetical protein WN48_11355 [Eufriesea mexicana]|uniref:XRCC4 coiled-coil domain-containing protein n=1 Tax=Eufriesea mexicana TaxID=516756 RepID=A0A310SMR4_9HYME|nr:PREDICTED: DNA repair protein xrcc4-like [Eufriesea mexicana]OAD58192.1 hypothetical protein WN48_11355 [Eufriesea mexicana]